LVSFFLVFLLFPLFFASIFFIFFFFSLFYSILFTSLYYYKAHDAWGTSEMHTKFGKRPFEEY
jgi:hypothetical protein